MNYICDKCGKIFEEPRVDYDYRHGGFYERFTVSPCCREDYEEAVECQVCGSLHRQDDLISGICTECFEFLRDDYKNDAQKCYDLGDKYSVELNAFLASEFSAKEIEEILLNIIKQRKNADFTNFIEEDKRWFVESARG